MSNLAQRLLLLAAILCRTVDAHSWSSDDTGLATFVSRPDLRPQTLNVTTYEPHRISAGYWFTAPYYQLHKPDGENEFRPGQIGPHIFDSQGDLIWSGAVEQDHQNAFDFRVAQYHGSPHLTFITERRREGKVGKGDEGIIMDSSYQVVKTVRADDGKNPINLHEFNVLPDNRALLITVRPWPANASPLNNGLDRIVKDNGFQEVDIDTGKTLFRWSCLDHVPVSDSYYSQSRGEYDYFHANAVDKTATGDYIVSGRYTSTVYKVSGRDGSIMWQLGGKRSDFELVDFDFGFQHHVRLIAESDTYTTISFFNNASDKQESIDDHSSGMIILLDMVQMRAKLLHKYDRPDGELTHLRGSVQSLPNGNVVVGWSMYGYTSEFTSDGRLVQEMVYSSERLSDYRTYKYEWKGFPRQPPTLKSQAYGTAETVTTVHHVSWNGATEVAWWRFYASDSPFSNNDSSVNVSKESARLLGSVPRTGFETMLISNDFHRYIFAEAITMDGESLGFSAVQETLVPPGDSYDEANFVASKQDNGMKTIGGRTSWSVSIVLGLLVVSLPGILLRLIWVKCRRQVCGRNHLYTRLQPGVDSGEDLRIDTESATPVFEKTI